MKKFYSMVLLLIASILAFNTSAKTVTFRTNMDGGIKVMDPNYNSHYFEDSSQAVEINWSDEQMHGNYQNCMLFAESGFQLDKVLVNGDDLVDQNGDKVDLSNLSEGQPVTLYYEAVPNGATVMAIVSERQAPDPVANPVITFNGNSNHVRITDSYGATISPEESGENAVWKIEKTTENQYSSYNIYANEGFGIKSVKGDNNDELSVSSSNYAHFYMGNFSTNVTYVIDSYDLTAGRTASATINVVDGEISDISAYRNGGSIKITEAEFEDFKFDPENDLPLTFAHEAYGHTLYKVAVNNEAVEQRGSQWVVNSLNDGDVITITVAYPDIDVPVNINCVNEGTKGIISTFTVNGSNIAQSVWSADDYTLKLGDVVELAFDQQAYTINSITVNGETLSSYYYHKVTINDESGLNIEIDAKALKPLTFIVSCNNWEKLIVKANYQPLELTGATSEFEIKPGQDYVTFSAAEGFFVSAIYCGETDLTQLRSFNLSNYAVDNEVEIEVIVEEYVRDKQFVLFFEEGTWNYRSLTLNPNGGDLRKEIYPVNGYNFVNFNDADLPCSLSIYGSDYAVAPIVYIDGEVAEPTYGMYPTENIVDGSVVKVYQSTPEEHSVEIQLGEDSGAQIHADYVTPYDGSNMTVHHGTHIVITAAPQVAILAEGSEAKSVPFDVKVGNQLLEADEEGKVVVPVTDDVKIQVGKAGTLSVDSILDETDAANGAVYNLQGVKVLDNAADVNNLPAGLYIANGKKIVVK